MRSFKILSKSEAETMKWGGRVARYLKSGDILCLFGELGSGKTTFVKGIAKGLRINPTQVNSPTFVLLNIYEGRLPLYHFDFYRLGKQQEISAIGYDEFFYDEGVTVVEWAERLKELMPKENLRIQLYYQEENERLIKISAKGKRYYQLMDKLI